MLILKAPQSEVLAAIQRVSGVTPSRSTLLIATNLLLRKAGDALSITSTDMNVQAMASAELGGDAGDFAITVSAKRLTDVLKSAPADQVVSLTEQDGKLTLKAGKSRFSLQTLPAATFPLMQPVKDAETEIVLPQRTLLKLLQAVEFAMGVHDVRYFLNGIYLACDGSTLTAVASDGACLAKIATPVDAPKCSVIVPRESVLHLVKMLAPSDDPVTIGITGHLATFGFGTMEFISKLVEGRYPDFERVLAAKTTEKVTLGRAPLLNALRAVSVMTTQKFKGVRMRFAPGCLNLFASDAAEEAENELEIDYDGQELQLAFDAVLLREGLASVSEDMVEAKFGDAMPLIVTIPGGDPTFRFVLMPMRL